MPLTLKITENAIEREAEGQLLTALGAAFLKHNDAADNALLPDNFPVMLFSLPKSRTYVNGHPQNIAQVELRVPPFALASPQAKQKWVTDATELVHAASDGRIAKHHIWVNMVFGEDLWGVNGQALSNTQLKEAIEAAAAPR